MRQTCRGIVLRQVRFGDQGCIVSVLQDQGEKNDYAVRLSTAQRKKIAGLLQVMTFVEFESSPQAKAKLPYASNFQLLEGLSPAMAGPVQGALCMFMGEVLQKITAEHHADTDLFLLAQKYLRLCLSKALPPAQLPLRFTAELIQWSGLGPDASRFDLGMGFSIPLQSFVPSNPRADPSFEMSPRIAGCFAKLLLGEAYEVDLNERRSLLQAMVNYLEYHVLGSRSIKSHLVLAQE